MINLNDMIEGEIENGYGDANAQAKVCQDVRLKAISASSLSRNVTIKGGVVMRSKTKNIRRATQDLDIGFRVLKLDSSNMKDVYYNPDEYTMGSLFGMADNIKDDRTPEDLLFQVMLDLGILLSSKIEETTIAGKKVFSVADGYLYACFDSDVSEETVKAIAQKKPYYAVFRDSGFATDSVATNFEQIFETYSPSTTRKVL